MNRFPLFAFLFVLAALLVPGSALARLDELGVTRDDPAPSCPPKDTCRVLTRTTAYQMRSGTVRNPYVVARNGRMVAFTLRVGDMTKSIIHYFNTNYGGTPRVRLTVLRTVRAKKTRRNPHPKSYLAVVNEGSAYHLQPYFGTTVTFALRQSVIVHRGDIVALTVPTWAPVLAVGLGTSDQWQASRPSRACNDNATQTALGAVKAHSDFACKYTTQRMTYRVTIVPTPKRKYDSKQNPIR